MKKIFLFVHTLFIICLGIKIVDASITFNYTELNLGIDVTQQLKISGDIIGNVSWTNSNNRIASLNNGYVTGLKLGTTYITAINGSYSTSCKINVIADYAAVDKITLSNQSGEILVNETKNLNAKIEPSNASNKIIFYMSSEPSVVSVDSEGNITGNKLGTAIITLTAENKSATYKVTVVDKVPLNGISISSQSVTLTEGDSGKLAITYTPSNATDKTISWKSSNPDIVTVDSSGNLKAISPGSATITATSHDGGYTTSSKITVNALDKTLKGISLNKTELSLNVDETDTLEVNYNPSNAENKEVNWSSSNKQVATITDGKVVAIKPGKVEIKVTSKEGNYEAICQVTVLSPPIESIKFVKEKQTIYLGSTVTLETISVPENAIITDQVWTISDETIATIKDGKVTGLKIGNATVTISDKEGKITATTEINVVEKPAESLMITINGYDLNFNPEVKSYTLKIKNENTLDIKVNRDDNKVTIGGNRDLKDGSIITITINEKKKTTYVINIKKQQDTLIYFIIIITILLLINIIRILIKNKKQR